MSVINIRGCNGSGKSTVVQAILAVGRARPIFGACGPGRPEAYELVLPQVAKSVYVLGSYLTPVGGCDRLGSADLVKDLVLKYQPQGHVLFEGLIISDYYGKLCEALEPFGNQVAVIFLNTPLEVCLERLHERQTAGKARGEKNVKHHFEAAQSVRKRMLENGLFRVLDLSSEEAPKVILELLKSC